jgi:putative two-component system response regulator
VLRHPAPILALAFGALWLRERAARRAAERLGAGLFESLLNAIDANDDDTGRHVRRVAASAIALADAAGLDDAAQREVEHVALFHDIGKIHAALFDIVHEGHRLTDADRRAIATHPERGADVLAPLEPFYPYLAEGVVSHHERWDGTGYPRGLRGAEIPLAARIVAISDSFDAIVHARRYSPGKSVDAALEAIRRGRGTQFDPDLVDLFLSPAVQRCVAAENARLGGRRRPDDRRRARQEPRTPDVAFRWRQPSPPAGTPR